MAVGNALGNANSIDGCELPEGTVCVKILATAPTLPSTGTFKMLKIGHFYAISRNFL